MSQAQPEGFASEEFGLRQLSVVAITNVCNQRCIFCLDRDINGVFSHTTEEALAVLREQAGMGSQQVLFMGGEPSRRRDFLTILTECKRLDLTPTMATNGTVFADEAYARQLLEHGVSLIGFSLFTHDPEVANFISGNRTTWRDQRKALENLNRLAGEFPFWIVFKHVLNRWNLRHRSEPG